MTDKYKRMLDEMLGVCRKYLEDLKDDERYWKVKSFIVRERVKSDIPHVVRKMYVLYAVSLILLFVYIPSFIIFTQVSEYISEEHVKIMGFDVYNSINILGVQIKPGHLFFLIGVTATLTPLLIGLGVALYAGFRYESQYKKLRNYYLSK